MWLGFYAFGNIITFSSPNEREQDGHSWPAGRIAKDIDFFLSFHDCILSKVRGYFFLERPTLPLRLLRPLFI